MLDCYELGKEGAFGDLRSKVTKWALFIKLIEGSTYIWFYSVELVLFYYCYICLDDSKLPPFPYNCYWDPSFVLKTLEKKSMIWLEDFLD